MFKSKTKKISIIAGAIASAITLSTFSGFAIGSTTESLSEQTIGSSIELISSSEQKVDSSIKASKDLMDEEIVEDLLPKVIELSTPGDYRLVGAEAANNLENQDLNEIIVNTNDTILINGNGKYNIILDNVNIYHSADSNRYIPMIITNTADVNLTLVGKNSLKDNSEYSFGLNVFLNAHLTINGSGEGASLDAVGKDCGIHSENDLIINDCTITATGKYQGIISESHLAINDSEITATGCCGIVATGRRCHYGINAAGNCEDYLTVTDSTITATGKDKCINCWGKLAINNSIINASSQDAEGIYCNKNSTITGSTITATGKDKGINCDANLEINDSEITATALLDPAIYCNDNLTTNNSILNASSQEDQGIYCTNYLTITGGAVNARKILAKNLILNSGELVTRSINDVAWKDVVWDGNTMRKMEKVFGTLDDKGSLIDARKSNTDGDAKCIGHLVKFNDPESNGNIYLFFIGNNAMINGAKIVDKDSDEVDYKMKDGNNFVTESNRNNYNDLELFFE